MTYFYVFKGDEKIILTLDNFEAYEGCILHSFGQAAHFVEGLRLDLHTKIATLLTLPLFEKVEEGARFLVQVAAESEGYKSDFIKTPFNGSLKEFFYSKFREIFKFEVGQLLNISQCQLLQSMDWADVERRYVNRLGGLIPRSFRYGDTEWVVPEAFDL